MTDTISRQATIDAFYLYPNINWTTLDILKKINEIPTIQLDNNSEMPNSSDVIDRQAAIDVVKESHECGWYLMETISHIEELPTVDAVEVVRCRDCKHLSNDRITPEFNRVCRLYGCGKKEYGFCDEGKRRTDE